MTFDYHFDPPPSTGQRLLIIDQNLKGFEGHHHDYTHAIIKAAQKRGLTVQLVTHRAYRGTTLAGAPVVARFAGREESRDTSLIMRAARGGLTGLPAYLRQAILSHLPITTGAARRPVSPDHALARQLMPIIAQKKLTKADHVLLHTLTESEFLGLAEVLAEEAAILPQLHILLRYDASEACRNAFQKACGAQHRISFWTDTQSLATHYRTLGCPAIRILPILHGLDLSLSRNRSPDAPLTLSFLGGARRDKGFQLLPGLIAALNGDAAYAGRIRFLIQATFGVSREEALMARTRRALRAFPRDGVTLIETPPERMEFQRAIISTDLMLLPYDPVVYRRRSSGLLIQAMAAGIPTIIPNHSWLSDMASPHAAIRFKNEKNFMFAVKQAITRIDGLSAAALADAPLVVAHHDADHYIALLIKRGTEQNVFSA